MSKGDKWRKTDYKKFFDNFNQIKFKKPKDSSKSEIKKQGKTTYKYK